MRGSNLPGWDTVSALENELAAYSVIFILFTNFQQESINTDALTKLNNRRKTDEYLSSQLPTVSKENPLHLFMCDINSFKAINDNYGHLEGDDALIILSNVIKETVGKHNGFAGRYGGDEFIITFRGLSYTQSYKTIVEGISNITKERCEDKEKPYEVTVSFGYVCCADPTIPLETYLNEADDKLYINKENRKKMLNASKEV